MRTKTTFKGVKALISFSSRTNSWPLRSNKRWLLRAWRFWWGQLDPQARKSHSTASLIRQEFLNSHSDPVKITSPQKIQFFAPNAV